MRKYKKTEVVCPTCLKETIRKVCPKCGAVFESLRVKHMKQGKQWSVCLPKIREILPWHVPKDCR